MELLAFLSLDFPIPSLLPFELHSRSTNNEANPGEDPEALYITMLHREDGPILKVPLIPNLLP